VDLNFKLSENQKISLEHLEKVCKYAQGTKCCRYIVYFEKPAEFFCVKKDNHTKNKIDSIAPSMKAQGDNCKGLPIETRTRPEGAPSQVT